MKAHQLVVVERRRQQASDLARIAGTAVDDSRHRFGGIRTFQFNVHQHVPGDGLEHLDQGGYPLAIAGVEPTQWCKPEFRDQTPAVCRTVHRLVVDDHHLGPAHSHVQLDAVHPERNCEREARQGVLGRQAGRAAMADNQKAVGRLR